MGVQPERGRLLYVRSEKSVGRGVTPLTVANQQIRTSYLAPGFSPSRSIQVSVPLGWLSVGKVAFRCVLTVGWSGDSEMRYRLSMLASVGIF